MRQNFQNEETNASVPLATALTAPGTKEQIQATEQAKADQDLPAIETVLASLTKTVSQQRFIEIPTIVLSWLFGSFALGTGVVFLLIGGMEGHFPTIVFDFNPISIIASGQGPSGHTLTVGGLTPGLLLLISGLCRKRAKRERKKSVRALTRYDDVRAVGPLIEALYLRDKTLALEAGAALIRLLPRLEKSDRDLLDDNQRFLLHFYLARSKRAFLPDNSALDVAILKAYSQIGDGTELPIVRRLAEGKAHAAKDARVREAAQAYLDEAARRTERERASRTLLRGSGPAQTAKDTLLRPAESGTETSPEQLLRASVSGETS